MEPLMDPLKKQAWIDALRSGEYPQGADSLRYKDDDGSDKFCCLGVLCELAVKDGLGIQVQTQPRIKGIRKTQYTYDYGISFPTNRVYQWAGFQPVTDMHRKAMTVEEVDLGTIVNMNDHGKSFDEIAKFIDENF